jgi:hypothetical protein
MGGEVWVTFPSNKVRDRMLGIIESHYDDALTLQPHVGPYRRPCFTSQGRKIEASYAIWFSGFGRLWMEALLKWAAFTAGTRKTIGGVTGPWLNSSSIGPYLVEMLDGQPDYTGHAEFYLAMGQIQLSPDDMSRFYQARLADLHDTQLFSKLFPEKVRPYREAIQTTLARLDTIWASGK